MKLGIIVGTVIGATAVAVAMSDNSYRSLMKKGKKMVSKKLDDMID